TGRPPPTAHRYTFNLETNRLQAENAAPAALRQDPPEMIGLLLGSNVSNIDDNVLEQIMADRPLLFRLESFLEQSNWQGKIAFTDQYEPDVYFGQGYIIVGADYLTEDGLDLHKELRILFKLDDRPATATDNPPTTGNAPTELTQPAKTTVEALFKDYLGQEIELDDLQNVMEDLPLMLKLEGFLTKTDGEGTIAFRDDASGKVSFEHRYIGLEDYHVEPQLDDENRPTIHQALRALFELPPLTPDIPMTEVEIAEGDETIENMAATGSYIEANDKAVTTVREIWEDRVKTNTAPVYPPGYIPNS
ncbi:MAG: hypothetical protein AAFQ09_11815, partial [Pseudomonadota bacterium]